MDRREFFKFLRSAPLVAPMLLAESTKPESNALFLGGEKVMELADNGDLVIGQSGNLRVHPDPKSKGWVITVLPTTNGPTTQSDTR